MRYKTKASWLGGPGILVLFPFIFPIWLIIQIAKLSNKPVNKKRRR